MKNKNFRLKYIFMTGLLATGLAACTAPNPSATQRAAEASQPIHAGEILTIMHIVNNGEIKQAGQALQRSDDPYVLYLAQLIVQDHMASNQRIAALAQTTGATADSSVLGQTLRTQAIDVMEGATKLTGKEFDCNFLQKQIEQHATTLKTLHEQLLPSATDPQVKEFLVSSAPRLHHHMKVAQDYQIGLQCPS